LGRTATAILVCATVVVLVAAALVPSGAARARAAVTCAPRGAPAGYVRGVRQALLAKRDLWGNRLLAAPGGPTYVAAARLLAPLVYAKARDGRSLTASGVYYLPFAFPFAVNGERLFALHVADGSQIVRRRVGGPALTIDVGGGGERYGSCLARLTPATLADGYLPILQTSYVDANGVAYTQESFVGRLFGTFSISFVHLTVDARSATDGAIVRLKPSVAGLGRAGDELVARGSTQLLFSEGGTFDGGAARYAVAPGQTLDIYAGWPDQAMPVRNLHVDERMYETARQVVSTFWQSRLERGASFQVPDEHVLDAERALLIQQLMLTWRYSAGNTYEELSFAEASDVAQVMASYGFPDVAKTILRFSLARLPARFTNWRAGERLVAGATYQRLFRDRAYLAEETPALARAIKRLGDQIGRRDRGGLLEREPYSSDVGREVYALHGQTVVWQGLLAMGRVWSRTGKPELAAQCRRLAGRLAAALRRAVTASERRLGDGSLYVPASLLDRRETLSRREFSRATPYWNLVMPYALASGFFRPHGAQAEGALRYVLGHGSRLLGLVRAGAGQLYGRQTSPLAGIDQVYGVNVSRFLADSDEPDQLVLSLYGTLGVAMTPDTFVSGESATVAPLHGAYARSMFQPPNAGGNAAFLETLRVMLVHETRGPQGAPRGLELAFATPRPWLADGKAISVSGAPTSFGSVGYSLQRDGDVVHVTVDPPASASPASLRLRLRVPVGERVVTLRNAGAARLDGTGTIDLTGATRHVEFDAVVAPA
jgi:hypothetical protein